MRHYFTRHLPPLPFRRTMLVGLGSTLAVGFLGALTVYAHVPLLIAPFGASCVLLFSVPASPLSQPAHVIGGHVVATLIGLAFRLLFMQQWWPEMVLVDQWWIAAIAVGLSIAVMAALRVTHPPAGADPLVIFSAEPHLSFVLFPVLIGAVALVAIATLYHRATGGTYPVRVG